MAIDSSSKSLGELVRLVGNALLPGGEVLTRLGGRAPSNCPRSNQVFAAITSPTLDFTDFVPLTTPIGPSREGFSPGWCGPSERLWRIRATGLELQRESGDGLPPLGRSVILGSGGIPAGASQGGSLTFKVRIEACSVSGNYTFDIDCGQPIEVFAESVNATILGPANGFLVTPATELLTLQGTLLDAVIATAINGAEESLGQRQAHLTQHFVVEAESQLSIPVPRYARRMQIYTGSGPNPAQWTRWIGDPAVITGLRTGTVDFNGPNSVLESAAVGDETHLQTDNALNDDRFFTIVWTIRP